MFLLTYLFHLPFYCYSISFLGVGWGEFFSSLYDPDTYIEHCPPILYLPRHMFEPITQAGPIIVPHLFGQLFTRACLSTKSGQSEFFSRPLQLEMKRNLFLYLVNCKDMEQDCQWPSSLIHEETMHGVENREVNT